MVTTPSAKSFEVAGSSFSNDSNQQTNTKSSGTAFRRPVTCDPGDLKHNYFNNGRLGRRDDFVYDYHSSIIRQKRFAEFF